MSVELPPHVDGVLLLTQSRTDRACSLDFMHIPRIHRELHDPTPTRILLHYNCHAAACRLLTWRKASLDDHPSLIQTSVPFSPSHSSR